MTSNTKHIIGYYGASLSNLSKLDGNSYIDEFILYESKRIFKSIKKYITDVENVKLDASFSKLDTVNETNVKMQMMKGDIEMQMMKTLVDSETESERMLEHIASRRKLMEQENAKHIELVQHEHVQRFQSNETVQQPQSNDQDQDYSVVKRVTSLSKYTPSLQNEISKKCFNEATIFIKNLHPEMDTNSSEYMNLVFKEADIRLCHLDL